MTHPVIAIIGAGHMGSSLIGGLLNDGHPKEKIWACDPHQETLSKLEKTFQIKTSTDNTVAIQSADVVIFAVKPQVYKQVAVGASAAIQKRKPLIMSVAAGIHEAHIQQWVGGQQAIVRTMPNTPALIGSGATALFANSFVNEEQRSIAESIMRAVGLIVWLPEEALMDTVTALSGSGPAYFFLVMEALQDAAEELGLPQETARLLTLQTALGAARMAIESGTPLTELRRHVTSPGGTTEKAISVLEENNVRALFRKAVQGAKQRSEELANLMGEKT